MLFTVTDTLEIRIDVRAGLHRAGHPMEYRMGPAHAHDTDSHLSEPNVRMECAKGLNNIRSVYMTTTYNTCTQGWARY